MIFRSCALLRKKVFVAGSNATPSGTSPFAATVKAVSLPPDGSLLAAIFPSTSRKRGSAFSESRSVSFSTSPIMPMAANFSSHAIAWK